MYRRYIKRVFDFIFALYLILPITLVVAVYAVLIKFEDGGPAFYAEKRVGKYGSIFKTYILRSMKIDTDDSQLTKIGRFIRKSGIDELPQIFNVLAGDMSFIGPRPDLLDYFKDFNIEELRKLQALPGINGYDQSYYGDSVDWKQQLQNDIYYVDNISFQLDLKILFKAIKEDVLHKRIDVALKSRSVTDEVDDILGSYRQ